MSSGGGRDILWVFNCLWLACCPPSAEDAASSFTAGIRLNVPDTIIFENGSPRFWLCTHGGRLSRRDLHGQVVGSTTNNTLGNPREKIPPADCMRYAVDGIERFWQQTNKGVSSSAGATCVVWYSDGQHEVLDTSYILKLSTSTAWRKQLMALQGYVAPQRMEVGVYQASEDDLFGSCGSMRDGAARVGLNMLTKAVANCAMGVCTTGSRANEALPPAQSAVSMSQGRQAEETRLDLMRAVYIVDSLGILWFSHADEMRVRPLYVNIENKTCINHGRSRVQAATQLVALELGRVLQLAANDGLSMEECFTHFDPHNCGCADADMLRKGFAKLGIGIPAGVAGALVLELGGVNAVQFSASDLALFCARCGIPVSRFRGNAPVRGDRSQGMLTGETLQSRDVHPTTENSLDIRHKDIIPHTHTNRPVARLGEMSKRKIRPQTSLSKDRATNGGEQGYSELVTPTHQAPRSSSSATSNTGEMIQTPTPPGLQQPQATPHVKSTERDTTRAFRWDNLPKWARQTSKSALLALMDHHKRSLRNIRAETATPITPVANPLKLRIKLNENMHSGASDGNHSGSSRPRSAQDEIGRRYGQRAVTPIDPSSRVDRRIACGKGLGKEDAKLHIGEGNVMSYRWLSRTVVKPSFGGTVLEATEALSASRDAMGLHVDEKKGFLLIVLPDLFMTLDYLERWLGGILEQNSRGQLLLIGSLGLPGTRWAEGTVLDSETQARGLSNLLWELLQLGDLCIDPPLCVAMMGLGSGANAVLQFSATHLLDAKFARLRDAVRFVALVNPFPVTPDTSLERQQVKRSLQTLKRVLEIGSHHEQLQALLSSLFSNEYITQHGRTTVLEQFWLQRKELQLSESERPASAPISSKIKNRRADTSRNTHDRKRQPAGGGVIQCINGVLHGTTSGTWCKDINLPLLLISSTRDALDSSQTAQHIRTSVEAQEVDSLFALVNGNRQNRLLVRLVEAGRELLQEAPVRTLQILSEAIHAAQMRPLFPPPGGARLYVGDVGDRDQPNHDRIDGMDRIDQTEELPSSCFSGGDTGNTELPCYGISNEATSVVDGSPTAEGHRVESVENESVYVDEIRGAPDSRAPIDATKKGRRAREFDIRKEQTAERKAKKERLKKQQELDRLKRTKREHEQFSEQQRACEAMQQEDSRSRAVDRYTRAFEVWSSSVADAKERALELTSARDSSEQKMTEDQLAHDRAAQHMQRVELFRQRKLDLLEQDEVDTNELVALRGMNCGEVDLARDTCEELLNQLCLLRRRVVKAMQTELLRRDQLKTFETQYSKIESGLHEAERLQRTHARGGITADVLGERSLQESADVDQAVAKQQVQLGIYQSVLKERLEMWNMAVSHVQKLKIAIRNKEEELRITLYSIGEKHTGQRKKLGDLRAKNESMATHKASVVSKTAKMRIRVKVLEKELSLLQTHNGRLFDTDILHVGLMQRISTVKMKQDVQIELATMSCRIKNNVQEMERIDQALKGNTVCGQDTDLNVQKLAQILRATEQRLDRIVSKAVVHELHDELGAGQEFRSPGVSELLTSTNDSLPETIRKKPNHQRSTEEKQWVALDILVNRELYQALSVVENEELQLNDEYKTELRAEDVARILQSPHEMQLALPHLKTPAEISAHKLLAMYTHEHGDAEFAKADEQSQDHIFATSPREIRSTQPTKAARRMRISADPNNLVPEKALKAVGVTRTIGHTQDTHTQQERGLMKEYGLQGSQQAPMDTCLHECHRTDLHGYGLDTSSCLAIEDSEVCQSSKTNAVKPLLGRQETLQRIIIFDTMSDVGIHGPCEDHEAMAVRVGEREVYRSAKRLLKPQESCTHTFSVIDLPPTYSVDLKVTVQFTGCMEARGFSRGKISAIFRRKGEYVKGLPPSARESIGFAPHWKQKLNTGDQFYQTPGTIFIQHTPRLVPLACGEFEVVVTALGLSEYSMAVVAGQSELCTSVVDKRITEVKQIQVRLQDLEGELVDTWEGVRLRERQYHVCNKLIEEARSECARCQEAIDDLCEDLRPREIEVVPQPAPKSSSGEMGKASTESGTSTGTPHSSSKSESTATDSTSIADSTTATSSSAASLQELSETERADTWNEVTAIELEHMHWGRLFTTRCQEKGSVKKNLHQLMKLRRDGKAEKAHLKEHLQHISAEIPIAVAAMQGPTIAAERTNELNMNPGLSSAGQPPSIGGSIARTTISLVTPAVKNRRAFERGGWEALTLEEQQWVTVDQAMCPHLYLWLKQRQEEEAQLELGQSLNFRAKPSENPAFDQCRFDRDELMRIMAEPFGDLTRKEAHVRKLMSKFHDEPQLLKSTTSSPPVHSGQHDTMLPHKIRLKRDKHRTVTEKEWISLDKVLNSQVWKRAKEHVPGTVNDQRPSESGGGSTAPFDKQGWTCPFSRDELMRIWGSGDGTCFATEDEKRAYTLLTTFNGLYQAPMSDSAKRGWKGVQMGKAAGNLHVDIDKRLRALQKELDRVSHNSNPGINSSALHVAPQRFPTSTLRLELEAEMDRLLREQVQQRERKNMYLIEDCSSSEEDEDHSHHKKVDNRRMRRLNRRASRGDMNIFAARKHMLLDAKKTTLQRETARRIAELGPGGCPACMSNPCKYTPVVNLEDTKARLESIADELHSARISKEEILERHLPKSVKRNEIKTFRRGELIEELSAERKHLRYMMKLHFIDVEFHDANRTSKQHMECVALHGYRTFLWTSDARVALEREHSRLVARMVATEIAGDILEWMLEGWHFGERQSRHDALGYVPSMKKIGMIKAGIDAKVKDEPSAEQARALKEEGEDTASAFTIPPGIDGSSWNRTSERVVKPGGIHDEEIGFSEKTMHFGLFCVAIMYFRAQWLLRQQRERASLFKLGWNVDTSVPVQAQRKAIAQTSITSSQAGHQRVKVRKEKEQAEVLADFAGFLAVEKTELDAALLIQRIYRGHIGRKAAQRWHAKRAEYNATNSLMIAATINLQRFMRGCWGRRRAGIVRAGVARWLAHLFDDESREFEAEVLSTNKLEALKRGIGDLAVQEEDSQSDT